jgi:hypothetical protein
MRTPLTLLLVLVGIGPLVAAGPSDLPAVTVSDGDPLPYAHCRWVPTAARTLRLNDINWTVDVELLASGREPAQISVALLERDADNRNALVALLDDPLPPGASLHLDDVVGLVNPGLWRPWRGAVVVCADAPGVEVWSRTSLVGPGEATSVGQGVPGLSMAEAVHPGTVGQLFGLREDERFRTHLGLLNPSPVAVEATIRLLDDDGMTRLVVTQDLPPYGQVQLNRVLGSVGGGLERGRAEVRCAAGPVFAYAILADNSSDDPSLIATRVTAD